MRRKAAQWGRGGVWGIREGGMFWGAARSTGAAARFRPGTTSAGALGFHTNAIGIRLSEQATEFFICRLISAGTMLPTPSSLTVSAGHGYQCRRTELAQRMCCQILSRPRAAESLRLSEETRP